MRERFPAAATGISSSCWERRWADPPTSTLASASRLASVRTNVPGIRPVHRSESSRRSRRSALRSGATEWTRDVSDKLLSIQLRRDTRRRTHEVSSSEASPTVPITTPRTSCHLSAFIPKARKRKRKYNHPTTNPSRHAGMLLYARDSAGENLMLLLHTETKENWPEIVRGRYRLFRASYLARMAILVVLEGKG
ncbi:hypothetical protein DFH08DRAFT_825257 [Mycena albidolilacea]|uniref:Uncharacterized protein n=1 Tax=Mycena albidolilacea TaxID=1033008 RepID=A0AAD6Z350_9AGAR|nr:hypothetical protein DFH08DRAFT_825257 [Mycena albidolilacea]